LSLLVWRAVIGRPIWSLAALALHFVIDLAPGLIRAKLIKLPASALVGSYTVAAILILIVLFRSYCSVLIRSRGARQE
jgi:uncharacterized membrane protein YhfC